MSQAQPGTPALANNYMKVFVQRDYSEGTAVKFQTRFPTELESRVSNTSCPVTCKITKGGSCLDRLINIPSRQPSTNLMSTLQRQKRAPAVPIVRAAWPASLHT